MPPPKDIEMRFGPCDRLNPGFGYQLVIQNALTGEKLLNTSRHPVTGKDLTAEGCVEVAAMYVTCGTRWGKPTPGDDEEPRGTTPGSPGFMGNC